MSNLPKNRVSPPKRFVSGLYDPTLIPREVDLNNLIQEVVIPQEKAEASKRVKQMLQTQPGLPVIPTTGPSRVPVPLTEAEAEEADRLIAKTLTRIQAFKQKLTFVRGQLDAGIASELDGKELSFTVDISKKQRVERALKRLYGEKRTEITYTDYKQLLKAKAELEMKEVSDYAAGQVDEDTDESDEKGDKN